jgi:hypothetical protein
MGGTNVKRFGLLSVGLASALTGCGTGRTHGDSPSNVSGGSSHDGSSAESSEGEFTIAQVKDAYIDDTVLVHAVHIRIDGNLIKSCQLDELEEDVCGRNIRMAPGPHRVAIGISCRNAETLRHTHPNGNPCEFTLEDGIVVGVGESLELDLTRASHDPEHFEDALTRKPGSKQGSKCHATLQALVATNGCNASGLREAAELAKKAQSQCADALEAPAVIDLLSQAYSTHSGLTPYRCFPAPALRDELPQLLTSGYSVWPAESLPEGTSSWSWVRASLIPKTDVAPPAELAALAPALTEAATRAKVFDQLAAVFTPNSEKGSGRKQALKAAMAAPFSLDPRTPEGHRNFVLMVTETQDAAYQDFIARGVEASEGIHCDRYPLARQLNLFFTRQGLSRPEWKAVQAMMTRTPRESHVHNCDYAFREDNQGAVPLAERLDWLFGYDCDSQQRHPALLGDRVADHLDPDVSLPAELRSQLIDEFNTCLTTRCRRESCSWFPER